MKEKAGQHAAHAALAARERLILPLLERLHGVDPRGVARRNERGDDARHDAETRGGRHGADRAPWRSAEIEVDGVVHTLGTGDFISYPASLPHRHRSTLGSEARLVIVETQLQRSQRGAHSDASAEAS